MKEIDGDEQPDKISITHSPFWVRIKNLPLNCRSDEHVKVLVRDMGEILDLEEDVIGIGRYRRVKIMLNVLRPLRKVQKIKDRRGREVQVEYVYERLPFFCFAYGIMGHSERECRAITEEDKKKKLGWGPELKATPRKGRTKAVEELENLVPNRKALFVTKDMEEEAERNTKSLALEKEKTMVSKELEKGEKDGECMKADTAVQQGQQAKTIAPLQLSQEECETTSLVAGVSTDEVPTPTLPLPCGVFSLGTSSVGEKEGKKGSGKTWKRNVRPGGRDKAVEVGSVTKKRHLDYVDMEIEDEDGPGKRSKQSPLT